MDIEDLIELVAIHPTASHAPRTYAELQELNMCDSETVLLHTRLMPIKYGSGSGTTFWMFANTSSFKLMPIT